MKNLGKKLFKIYWPNYWTLEPGGKHYICLPWVVLLQDEKPHCTKHDKQSCKIPWWPLQSAAKPPFSHGFTPSFDISLLLPRNLHLITHRTSHSPSELSRLTTCLLLVATFPSVVHWVNPGMKWKQVSMSFTKSLRTQFTAWPNHAPLHFHSTTHPRISIRCKPRYLPAIVETVGQTDAQLPICRWNPAFLAFHSLTDQTCSKSYPHFEGEAIRKRGLWECLALSVYLVKQRQFLSPCQSATCVEFTHWGWNVI